MQGPPAGVSVEALLEHRGWVRGLARSLAADDASADDLAQEAWLTALRRPPQHAGGLRGWWSRVVRSRAADAGRAAGARAARERAAARPEAEPSTEHLARVAELQARVARAVTALPEPLRAAVLLRYFEELPLEAVAARTGTTVDAVRGRLRKALALLRDRLDADHDGDRRAWIALLGTLAGREGPSIPGGAITGGVFMTMKAKAGIAAAVVLLACWWAFRGGEEPPSAPAPEVAAIPAPHPLPPPAAETPRDPAPASGPADSPPLPASAVDPPPAPPVPPDPVPAPEEGPAAPEPPADESLTIRYTGRVLDGTRRPVAGAVVTALLEGEPDRTTVSGGAGRFEIRVARPAAGPRAPGTGQLLFRAETADGRLAVLAFPHRDLADAFLRRLDLVLDDPRTLEVEVRDDAGPVEGVEVLLASPAAVLARGRTDALGRVPVGPIPAALLILSNVRIPVPLLLSARDPLRGRGSAPVPVPLPAGPIRIRLSPGRPVVAEVLDADTGKGIPGAQVLLRETAAMWEGQTEAFPLRPGGGPLETDRAGRAIFPGVPGTGPCLLAARAEGYGEVWNPGWMSLQVRPGETAAFRLRRRSFLLFRWPVTEEAGPPPPEGSMVLLPVDPNINPDAYPSLVETGWDVERTHGTARVERDPQGRTWLVAEGVAPGSGFRTLAVAPDGRVAWLSQRGRDPEGPPVSFAAPRTAVVEVRDGEGRPAAGIHAMFQGGREPSGREVARFEVTDAAGRATLSGLYSGEATVHLLDPRTRRFTKFPAGRIDLSKDGALLEARLEDRTAVEIRVRILVDGEPRLPSGWSLLVMEGGGFTSFRSESVDPADEDPEAGTIRLTAWLLHPEGGFRVNLNTAECQLGPPEEVPAGPRDGPVELVFMLRPYPAAVLAARGAAPSPPPATPVKESREAKEARLNRLLDTERTSFIPQDLSVAEALSFLGAEHGIPIVLDTEARLAAETARAEVAVKDRSLREAIEAVLERAEGLGFEVKGGVVLVTRR